MTDRRPPDLGSLFGDDASSSPAAPAPRLSATSFMDDDETPLATATPVGFLSDEAKAEAKAAADAAWKASRKAATDAWQGVQTNAPVVGAALDDFLVANRPRMAMALVLIVIVEILVWSWFGGTPAVPEEETARVVPVVIAPPNPAPAARAPAALIPPQQAPGLAGDSPVAVAASEPVVPPPRPPPHVAAPSPAPRPSVARLAAPAKPKPVDAEEAARMDAWFKDLQDKQH